MTTYTLTCSSMSEKDVALIRSLLGIVNKGSKAEWVYVDGPDADVAIVDVEERSGVSALKKGTARAMVAYASPDQTLIPNTFVLGKPARARDFMEVLASIQQRLEAASA